MNKRILYIVLGIFVLGGGYLLFGGTNKIEESFSTEITEDNQKEKEGDKGKKISVPGNETVEPLVREIIITAKKFEFDKTEIQVKKGEKIKIIVIDSDRKHGIIIPDLIDPPTQGDYNEMEIPTDKAGEFYFYCATPCGLKHGSMNGKIVII